MFPHFLQLMRQKKSPHRLSSTTMVQPQIEFQAPELRGVSALNKLGLLHRGKPMATQGRLGGMKAHDSLAEWMARKKLPSFIFTTKNGPNPTSLKFMNKGSEKLASTRSKGSNQPPNHQLVSSRYLPLKTPCALGKFSSFPDI